MKGSIVKAPSKKKIFSITIGVNDWYSAGLEFNMMTTEADENIVTEDGVYKISMFNAKASYNAIGTQDYKALGTEALDILGLDGSLYEDYYTANIAYDLATVNSRFEIALNESNKRKCTLSGIKALLPYNDNGSLKIIALTETRPLYDIVIDGEITEVDIVTGPSLEFNMMADEDEDNIVTEDSDYKVSMFNSKE